MRKQLGNGIGISGSQVYLWQIPTSQTYFTFNTISLPKKNKHIQVHWVGYIHIYLGYLTSPRIESESENCDIQMKWIAKNLKWKKKNQRKAKQHRNFRGKSVKMFVFSFQESLFDVFLDNRLGNKHNWHFIYNSSSMV